MNCRDVGDFVQERLDGLTPSEPDGFQLHLAGCRPCRERQAAAERLERGLLVLVPPAPPPDLSRAIVAAVLADRRRRQGQVFRRLGMVVAMAASLFLVFLAGDRLRQSSTISPVPLPASDPESGSIGSLREHVAEVGTAVASLTRKTADGVFDQGKMLYDVVVVPTPEATLPPSPIEPPVRSLAVAGQAIGAGLEPVASSARRAWDLLVRDVPLPPEEKP